MSGATTIQLDRSDYGELWVSSVQGGISAFSHVKKKKEHNTSHACHLENPTTTTAAADGQPQLECMRTAFCHIPLHDNHCEGQKNLIKMKEGKPLVTSEGGKVGGGGAYFVSQSLPLEIRDLHSPV